MSPGPYKVMCPECGGYNWHEVAKRVTLQPVTDLYIRRGGLYAEGYETFEMCDEEVEVEGYTCRECFEYFTFDELEVMA